MVYLQVLFHIHTRLPEYLQYTSLPKHTSFFTPLSYLHTNIHSVCRRFTSFDVCCPLLCCVSIHPRLHHIPGPGCQPCGFPRLHLPPAHHTELPLPGSGGGTAGESLTSPLASPEGCGAPQAPPQNPTNSTSPLISAQLLHAFKHTHTHTQHTSKHVYTHFHSCEEDLRSEEHTSELQSR